MGGVLPFNEAPIHESGKSRITLANSHSTRTFNEAPIHESGKWSVGPSSASITPCAFNEAPIHESGKYEPNDPDEDDDPDPSMRPRFMNRGSVPLFSGEIVS